MGCCGLIQSAIIKTVVKEKITIYIYNYKIILKVITYLLYFTVPAVFLFILYHCTVDCRVSVVIENHSERVI